MSMIDIHSHILPGIDDGSRDVETSLGILNLCAKQGVDLMVATPHFYADTDRVESFLARRREAYEKLDLAKRCPKPDILLGAEVAFFEGMGRAEKIPALTIEGTDVLLLEMPFRTWDDSVLREIEYLLEKRKLRIIIAHLERFLRLPGNDIYIRELLALPVFVQINAESLLDRRQRGSLLKLFKKGQAQLLGSDCHGMHRRPPNLWEGRKVLEHRLGTEYLERMDKLAAELLGR
ncbi:MAG: capsular polysaccharide biosynthesis protein [Roseburia sp.]|nr:capsular polysaccharide biosynthesis protein [Roseburia sp.]